MLGMGLPLTYPSTFKKHENPKFLLIINLCIGKDNLKEFSSCLLSKIHLKISDTHGLSNSSITFKMNVNFKCEKIKTNKIFVLLTECYRSTKIFENYGSL